jgi:23S rRNA pseudouridine955/2504/2580 synthase
MQKAFKKRDVKVNGTRVGQDFVLSAGDKLEIYIVDEILESRNVADVTKADSGIKIVYEDENVLIVNKEQGVPVHPDRNQAENTLIDMVRKYICSKENYKSVKNDDFLPSLCHRLDQNTGGLVIIAKNRKTLDIITKSMSSGEIRKYYQCLVKGRMEEKSAQRRAYLTKDENKSRVFVNDVKSPGALEIITGYRVLDYMKDIDVSLLEVDLRTGRTHQIRAHLAHLGHPVIGDGKYGTNAINRPLGLKKQALWACKLKFDLSDAGRLSYLIGAEFSVKPGFPSLIMLKERLSLKLGLNK